MQDQYSPPAPPASAPPSPTRNKRPGIGHWLLHVRKTARLLGAIMRDRRVAFIRKLVFVVLVVGIAVVLFIPDTILATLVFPIIGPIFGIPAGFTVDVAVIASVMYGLLAIFPSQIVSEHTHRLYGPNPDIRPHTH